MLTNNIKEINNTIQDNLNIKKTPKKKQTMNEYTKIIMSLFSLVFVGLLVWIFYGKIKSEENKTILRRKENEQSNPDLEEDNEKNQKREKKIVFNKDLDYIEQEKIENIIRESIGVKYKQSALTYEPDMNITNKGNHQDKLEGDKSVGDQVGKSPINDVPESNILKEEKLQKMIKGNESVEKCGSLIIEVIDEKLQQASKIKERWGKVQGNIFQKKIIDLENTEKKLIERKTSIQNATDKGYFLNHIDYLVNLNKILEIHNYWCDNEEQKKDRNEKSKKQKQTTTENESSIFEKMKKNQKVEKSTQDPLKRKKDDLKTEYTDSEKEIIDGMLEGDLSIVEYRLSMIKYIDEEISLIENKMKRIEEVQDSIEYLEGRKEYLMKIKTGIQTETNPEILFIKDKDLFLEKTIKYLEDQNSYLDQKEKRKKELNRE